MINPNDPAMPCQSDLHGKAHKGLTIREQFAAMAMQGLLSNRAIVTGHKNTIDIKALAESANNYANALIEQLNKTESK